LGYGLGAGVWFAGVYTNPIALLQVPIRLIGGYTKGSPKHR
jgi:hypothetical protein